MFRMNWYLLLIPAVCHGFSITNKQQCCRHSNQQRNRCRNRPSTDIRSSLLNDEKMDVDPRETSSSSSSCDSGFYRPFVNHAWQKLMNSHLQNLSLVQVPIELGCKETVAPGIRDNTTTVRITIEAATASQNNNTNSMGPIQYARYALIETIPTPSTPPTMDGVVYVQIDTTIQQPAKIHTDGIQVLNMVIIPYKHTGLPVFGADFVALPGNKHLLLLDAQPVRGDDHSSNSSGTAGNRELYDDWFQQWYERNDIQGQFDWGGDLPGPVQQYVSKYALWTRFTGSGGGSGNATVQNSNLTDPIEIIRGPVMDVFIDHFQTYLQLLSHYESSSTHDGRNQRYDNTNSSRLLDYLTYRLDNDPARPMLKRLFGAEWTEQVLHDVLFPIHLF